MKRRRLRKHAADLEILAFINLIVVLVPFLLSTAVFSRLAVMDLQLPAANSAMEKIAANNLQLEIVVRRDALEVGDRIGGLIQRIERRGDGADIQALSSLLVQVKARFPDKREATLLAEPSTPYDDLVQVMDAMRSTVTADGAKLLRAELFPSVSIGDAPLRAGESRSAAVPGATAATAAAPAAAPAAVPTVARAPTKGAT
ncbi:MAG: biopolymer transporter ExbD [Rubrivivax sp.]|nr:biopolymer transporter ExbD [Rubrivivax sp.]